MSKSRIQIWVRVELMSSSNYNIEFYIVYLTFAFNTPCYCTLDFGTNYILKFINNSWAKKKLIFTVVFWNQRENSYSALWNFSKVQVFWNKNWHIFSEYYGTLKLCTLQSVWNQFRHSTSDFTGISKFTYIKKLACGSHFQKHSDFDIPVKSSVSAIIIIPKLIRDL